MLEDEAAGGVVGGLESAEQNEACGDGAAEGGQCDALRWPLQRPLDALCETTGAP